MKNGPLLLAGAALFLAGPLLVPSIIAQESTLSDARAAELKARGEDHPAMVYYEGRKRVAAELARNGGDVDRLFAVAD